jgi:hypothetical protein
MLAAGTISPPIEYNKNIYNAICNIPCFFISLKVKKLLNKANK